VDTLAYDLARIQPNRQIGRRGGRRRH